MSARWWHADSLKHQPCTESNAGRAHRCYPCRDLVLVTNHIQQADTASISVLARYGHRGQRIVLSHRLLRQHFHIARPRQHHSNRLLLLRHRYPVFWVVEHLARDTLLGEVHHRWNPGRAKTIPGTRTHEKEHFLRLHHHFLLRVNRRRTLVWDGRLLLEIPSVSEHRSKLSGPCLLRDHDSSLPTSSQEIPPTCLSRLQEAILSSSLWRRILTRGQPRDQPHHRKCYILGEFSGQSAVTKIPVATNSPDEWPLFVRDSEASTRSIQRLQQATWPHVLNLPVPQGLKRWT